MSNDNAKDLVKNLSFSELQAVSEAARERAIEIRETGIRKLAEKFDREALETVGMSAREVLKGPRKGRRGRPSKKAVVPGGNEFGE